MQTLKKLTDDQLVAQYAQGRNEAFDALLSRHQSRVFSYILHIVKNRDLAEDIFQEVFLRYIRKQPHFENETHEKAWFIRVTINCSKSLFQLLKRVTYEEFDDLITYIDEYVL